MQQKPKRCNKCNFHKIIWKRHEGNLYCKECWFEIKPSVFKNSNTLKSKKRLNKKSSKQEKLDALYSVLRASYLKRNPYCKASLKGCQINASDVHHKAGRGIFLLDETTFLPVCRICHSIIEENPLMAKAMGFSISREEAHGNQKKD